MPDFEHFPKKNFIKRTSFFIPSITNIIFVLFFVTLSIKQHSLLGDGDTGWHIRVGQHILSTLSIPSHDFFSYRSPSLPFIAHEWLSELIMAIIYKGSGLTGIVIFFSFIIATTYCALFNWINNKNHCILINTIILLLVILSSKLHWLARPHLFSTALMLYYYYSLNEFQDGNTNKLYLLIPLMLLWANLHGGFIIGFILLGIYLVGNIIEFFNSLEKDRYQAILKIKAITLVIFGCLGVTFINPYGYHILLFPLKFFSQQYMINNVDEFLSPNFHKNLFKPFEVFLIISFVLISLSKKNLNAIELMLTVLFLHMSLYSGRYIPLFCIILLPILIGRIDGIMTNFKEFQIARWITERSNNISLMNNSVKGYFWSALSIIIIFFLAASGSIKQTFDKNIKPLAAIDFILIEPLPGNMMNNDEFGDLIIYFAYPRYKVFIDGRIDMYGVTNLKEYKDVVNFKPEWENILSKYQINWMIIPSDGALSIFLCRNEDWKLIYSDKVANIFIKNIPENKRLIDKYKNIEPVYKSEETL